MTSYAKRLVSAFVFDDLGGGSPIIAVYPAEADWQVGKVNDGTGFRGGDSAAAECKVTARKVTSDTSPAVHEKAQSSDQWVYFHAQGKALLIAPLRAF